MCYVLVIRISFHFDGPLGAQMAEMKSTTTATQNWSNLSVKSTKASAPIARSAEARHTQNIAKVGHDDQRAIDSSGTFSAITALVLRVGAKLGVQPLLILQQIERALDESMPWLDFNRKVPIYVVALGGTATDEGLDALAAWFLSTAATRLGRAPKKPLFIHKFNR